MKLKDLFRKKQGGTVLGNLVRKAGDAVTGGTFSGIFPKPTTLQPFDIAQIAAAKEAEKRALEAAGLGVEPVPSPSQKKKTNIVAPNLKTSDMLDKLKANWKYIAGGLVAVVAAIWFSKGGKKSSRRY